MYVIYCISEEVGPTTAAYKGRGNHESAPCVVAVQRKELQYELYRQYISYNVALARDKAKHEYRVIDSGDVRSFNIRFKWPTP